MKKNISTIILKLFGWKTSITKTKEMDRCVMIAAPHTSNWDFFFAILIFWKYDIKFHFFIKDFYMKNIFGMILKKMGAIGVNRGKANNLVDFASKILIENKEMVILVPAEGTRKKVDRWRTGFYHIAKKANVPIALGFLDFKEKIAGVGPLIHTTESIKHDFEIIQNFYKNIHPKHVEKYNNQIF